MRLLLSVLALAVVLPPAQALAALSTLSQFDPSQTAGLCGVATNDASGDVWAYACFGTGIDRYSSAGTYIGTVPRPGESANDVDVEVAPVAITLGDAALPAGTLLFINGETGFAEIHAIDPGTGAVLKTLVTVFGVSHVVGGAYHRTRATFFLVQDRVAGAADENRIAEIDPVTGAVINSFQTTGYFSVNFGDIDICGSSGNLLVVSSDEPRIAEITADGVFVQYHNYPAGVSSISGIGQDDSTGDTRVGGTGGNTWLLDGLPCDGVSAVPPDMRPFVSVTARPNPARGQVTILYSLPADSPVKVNVYDVTGRRVHGWTEGHRLAGPHETVWNGRDGAGTRVRPGVYFYIVSAESWKARGSVVILD